MNKIIAAAQIWLTRLTQKEEGQALVEYALILALVAVVVIAAIIFLGGGVHNTLQNVANTINNP